ncbi:hypothetical protein JOD45_002131 [Scopulibacillus daqui]|uniref:Uncharacterized protein n=1 Tax=Scopulibacillus daqui TaxID=1469162 RepID=A0ABS2Q1A7_9BACL|nr:hypothetical protein [Scopulibacillus daqui]MBM7645906.1 hypothetical protein [Scopulibacillus daqui]
MKFNKKTDFPTILAFFLLILLGLGGVIFILSIPFFSIFGFTSILELLHIKNLISIDSYSSFALSFIYVCGFILSVWALIIILELIFVFAKKRGLFNIHSKSQKGFSFIVLIAISTFITKGVILDIFQRIHASNIFVLALFFIIYLIFFTTSDTYKKI